MPKVDISFKEKLLDTIPENIELSKVDDVQFSPDGNRVAYKVNQNGKRFVVVDSKSEPEFDSVGELVFSPDGKRFGYEAAQSGKEFIVVDGEKKQEYDFVGKPIFNFDGSTLAYIARNTNAETEEREFVIVNDEKGQSYKSIIVEPVFSKDGNTLAYVGAFGNNYAIKTKPVIPFAYSSDDTFTGGKVILSPNGDAIAYARHSMSKKGKVHFSIWRDFTPFTGAAYDSVLGAVFSPDGNKVVYVAHEREDSANLNSSLNDFIVIVDKTNEKEGPKFGGQGIRDIAFSPDGKRIAYSFHGNGFNENLVVDEMRGPNFSKVSSPAFSFDGSKVVYVAREQNKSEEFIVWGDKRSQNFELVQSPAFSPDGKEIAFGAKQGRQLWWKVISAE